MKSKYDKFSTLGNETLARSDGPETSKEAADFLRGSKILSLLQQYVLAMVRRFPNFSMRELYEMCIQRGADITWGGFSTRYSELNRAGLIKRNGRTTNRSGRGAFRWVPVSE